MKWISVVISVVIALIIVLPCINYINVSVVNAQTAEVIPDEGPIGTPVLVAVSGFDESLMCGTCNFDGDLVAST